MKRILLIIAIILSTSCSAMAGLLLLRARGEVMMADGGGSRRPCPRERLSRSNVLILPASSKVSILDDKTNAVYTFQPTKAGRYTVKQIIDETSSKASSSAMLIARQAAGSIADCSKGHVRQGASVRDSNEEQVPEEEIAALLRVLSTISEATPAVDTEKIEAELITDEDSISHFRINNLTDSPIYANIVVVRDAQPARMLILPRRSDELNCLYLPVGESDLEEFEFLYYPVGASDLEEHELHGLADTNLYIVTSPVEFDSSLINLLLRKPETRSATPTGTIRLTPIIRPL